MASGPSQPPQGSLLYYVLFRLYSGPRGTSVTSRQSCKERHATSEFGGDFHTQWITDDHRQALLVLCFEVLFLLKGRFLKRRLTGEADNVKVAVKLCSGFL